MMSISKQNTLKLDRISSSFYLIKCERQQILGCYNCYWPVYFISELRERCNKGSKAGEYMNILEGIVAQLHKALLYKVH